MRCAAHGGGDPAHLFGKVVYVESAGVRAGDLDPLAVEVMEEIGLEIGKHQPQGFEDLEDSSFDLVITLSPEAQHKAVELTRTARHRGRILADHGPHGRRGLARAAPGRLPRGARRAADGGYASGSRKRAPRIREAVPWTDPCFWPIFGAISRTGLSKAS